MWRIASFGVLVLVYGCLSPQFGACSKAEQHGRVYSEAKWPISQHPHCFSRSHLKILLLPDRAAGWVPNLQYLSLQGDILDPNHIMVLLSKEESYGKEKCSLEKLTCKNSQALFTQGSPVLAKKACNRHQAEKPSWDCNFLLLSSVRAPQQFSSLALRLPWERQWAQEPALLILGPVYLSMVIRSGLTWDPCFSCQTNQCLMWSCWQRSSLLRGLLSSPVEAGSCLLGIRGEREKQM